MIHPRRYRKMPVGYTEFKPDSVDGLYSLAGKDTFEAYVQLEEQLLLNREIPDEQLPELWGMFMKGSSKKDDGFPMPKSVQKDADRLITYWEWANLVGSGVSTADAEKYMTRFEKKLNGLYRLKLLAPEFYTASFDNVTGAHLIFMYLAHLTAYLRQMPDDCELSMANIPYPDKAKQDKKVRVALKKLGFENISGDDMWEVITDNLHFFRHDMSYRNAFAALGFELLADVMEKDIFINMDLRDKDRCYWIVETVLNVKLDKEKADENMEKSSNNYAKNWLDAINGFKWVTDIGDKTADAALKKEAEKLRFMAARQILATDDAETMMAAFETGLIQKEDTPQVYLIAKNMGAVKHMPYLILQQHKYC